MDRPRIKVRGLHCTGKRRIFNALSSVRYWTVGSFSCTLTCKGVIGSLVSVEQRTGEEFAQREFRRHFSVFFLVDVFFPLAPFKLEFTILMRLVQHSKRNSRSRTNVSYSCQFRGRTSHRP